MVGEGLRVKISVFSILRKVMGKESFHMDLREGATLEDLIEELSKIHGEAFRREVGRDMMESLKKGFNIFVNGKIRDAFKEKDLGLKDGDEILIVQPIGGG